MNEFIKKIKLSVDSKELDVVKDQVNRDFSKLKIKDLFENNQEISENIKSQIAIKKQLRNYDEVINELDKFGLTNGEEYLSILEKQKTLKQELADLGETSEELEIPTSTIKSTMEFIKQSFKGIFDSVKDSIKNSFDKMKSFVKDIFNSAISDIKQQLNFNSSGSGFSEEAYNQQLEYGFNDGQNYAFTKALEQLNASQEEYAMGFYNQARQDKFNEFFELYKKQYEEMKSSGYLDNLQAMKDSFQKYQEEFKSTIMKFISENGELIVNVLQASLGFLKFIFTILNDIFSIFSLENGTSEYESSQNIQNILNSGSTNNSQNNNFKINNTLISNNTKTTNVDQIRQASQDNYQQVANNLKL